MLIYYRDDNVVVTSNFIQVEGRRFRIDELEYVWHAEAGPTWRTMRRGAGRGMINTSMLLAGIAGAIVLIGLLASAYSESRLEMALGNLPIPRNTLLLVAAILLVVGFAPLIFEWALIRIDDSYDKGGSVYEIRALVQGQEIVLLRLADATLFGKIYRAMQRALEDQ
jgi:hypothetical protein